MKRRMYYLLPDIHHARKTFDDLLLARIPDRHIHFISRDDIDLGDLPEASFGQRSDVMHGAEYGVLIGGITGIIVALILLSFPPDGLNVGPSALLAFGVLGGIFGVWVGSLIGSDVPNSQLESFAHPIEQGWILMMVDVPRNKMEPIKTVMSKRHPEADARGVEPTIPAFP